MSPETKVETFGSYSIHYTDHGILMEFTIFEIEGFEENKSTGLYDVPLFGADLVESCEGVEPFWRGGIKWDGCSNWEFGTDSCMAHFCGKKNATFIGTLMARCYELAEKMSGYDPCVAEGEG